MFLLLYVTDDAFYVTEEVLLLLAYYLQFHADIIFEAIFFVAFWPDGRPHMRMPFPHREDLRLRDMSHISKQQVINLDVSDSELIASDVGEQTITVRQNLPPGADLRLLPDSLKAHIPGFEALITELQSRLRRGAERVGDAEHAVDEHAVLHVLRPQRIARRLQGAREHQRVDYREAVTSSATP